MVYIERDDCLSLASHDCQGHKSIVAVPQIDKYRITACPSIPLLGTYPRDMKTYVYINTCTQKFIATLLKIAPN
jgi:hypothetical protein